LVASIEKLESQNWALDSAVIDALKFLGALDSEAEAQRENIRDEIQQALAEPETDTLCDMALSLCVRMFDHPFDTVYYEEIDNLSEDAERTLLRRAVSAPEARQSLTLSWLIGRVVDFDDANDASRIKRFAKLPSNRNVFPQEEWASFMLAVRFLGRHGLALPESNPLTPSETCLSAIRDILRAYEAKDIQQARQSWRTLADADCNVAVGCLSEVQRALVDHRALETGKTYPALSLTKLYPVESLALSRNFLDGDLAPIYHHQAASSGSGVTFALYCVAELGDRSDVSRLRKLTRESPFAKAALEGLRMLEVGEVR
jgi:plasmid stabilization system protein ParE